jgi:predicted transcriptional regulator of viral defense system
MQDKRQIVINHAQANGGKITSAEAQSLLKHHYYCNHKKYVSEIISRLVNCGFFIRVKKGHYEINPDYRPHRSKVQLDNKQQQNLF